MTKKITAVIAVCIASASLYCITFEFFAAFPIIISDVSALPVTYQSSAFGIGVTTLEDEQTFGITVTGLAYVPFDAQLIKENDAGKYGVSELFLLPFGLHFSIGCTVLPVETNTVYFPITVSFHSKTDFLKTETHIDMGVAAAAGIKVVINRFNIFARAEVFLDMYRIIIPYQEKLDTAGPSVFGVTPQVGFGITF
jgi:hypothetical protein